MSSLPAPLVNCSRSGTLPGANRSWLLPSSRSRTAWVNHSSGGALQRAVCAETISHGSSPVGGVGSKVAFGSETVTVIGQPVPTSFVASTVVIASDACTVTLLSSPGAATMWTARGGPSGMGPVLACLTPICAAPAGVAIASAKAQPAPILIQRPFTSHPPRPSAPTWRAGSYASVARFAPVHHQRRCRAAARLPEPNLGHYAGNLQREGAVMPTLRPQVLSGLVVIPTVVHDGSLYRVSIATDTGMTRPGPPPAQVVSREDLIVELRHPVEGRFEPVASPDPGPLPVRALRALQARGEFTFSQGVNAPTELVVTLRTDRKTFPMSQTLAPTSCLGGEPEEGDRFPAARPVVRGPAIVRGVLQRLPQIVLPTRARCCLTRFDAPHSTTPNPAAKSELFEID